MCWNKNVSFNTFIFSISVLLLIMYNNAYTPYKIKELNNKWVYLFFLSFIFMQFIEYFIWTNINNPFYNTFFSIMALLLLGLQPIASLLMLKNNTVKMRMILLYILIFLPFSLYNYFSNIHINSTISSMKHLQWNLITNKNINSNILFGIWVFFFLFSFIYDKQYTPFAFAFILLSLTKIFYYKDGSIGSMWCWVVNSIFIYYAIYLLWYLPFIINN